MQQSSELDWRLGGCACQGAGRADQPRKVDGGHHPGGRSKAAAEQIFRYAPLSSGLDIRAQDLRPA